MRADFAFRFHRLAAFGAERFTRHMPSAWAGTRTKANSWLSESVPFSVQCICSVGLGGRGDCASAPRTEPYRTRRAQARNASDKIHRPPLARQDGPSQRVSAKRICRYLAVGCLLRQRGNVAPGFESALPRRAAV